MGQEQNSWQPQWWKEIRWVCVREATRGCAICVETGKVRESQSVTRACQAEGKIGAEGAAVAKAWRWGAVLENLKEVQVHPLVH